MRYSAFVLLAIWSVGSIAHGQKKDPAKKDADLIQGVWKGVSSISDGKETPKAELDVMRLIVKGDRWNYAIGDGAPIFDPAPKFVLNSAAKPKTIDVVSTKQKGKSLLRGIYEIEGDTMKVCFAVGNAERPKEFAGTAGSKSGVTEYKRSK
jgi:uncharacterized protein (TIGR03067 family)